MAGRSKEIRLKGSPICAGIAIGKPYLFSFTQENVPEFSIASEEVEEEISRYRRALLRSKNEVQQLKKQLEYEGAWEGAAILDSHLQIMQDPSMTTKIEQEIRLTLKNTESIFQAAIKAYELKFKKITDKVFRERLIDIHDIARRILRYLRESVHITLADVPSNSVVFAHELAPSDTAEANRQSIEAFVTQNGGETSHAAIMAKAKGIPFVASVNFPVLDSVKCNCVIVDGCRGDVILNPTKSTLLKYKQLREQLITQFDTLAQTGNLEAETIDGYKVRLSANVEMFNELDMLHEYGGNGIGLFRSEYLFLTQDSFPSEEEQYHVYCRMVENMRGLPVVIRTFDIGGDKFGKLQRTRGEDNPFLGCRAIRLMLKERETFKSQLRAIVRASAHGDVSILFPMVSGLPELMEAKSVLKEVQEELRRNDFVMADKLKVGCMIEVPSAAITCDALAKECDFLSIGTNDLVGYSLAVDRGNPAMSYLYSPTHPSVIRLIKMIVVEGNRNGIPVTVCGEVAADPRYTSLLLGLGVHELSVASRYLPLVKQAIRYTSIVDASQLAEDILAMATAQEIQEALMRKYEEQPSSLHALARKGNY
ncbi:MAG: phosphoenolpyruvate--protein phosphotransferase [Parachlamydiales bacterium]|nr:phosphoenolpyruvate--protein phosphotransferase [Parachlamydiales bacterium]